MGNEGGGVTIRQEAAGDAFAIAAVVTAAFGSPVEARLVEMIRASAEFIPELALVADSEGDIVGHVMISHAHLDRGGDDRRIAMLSPLAVAPTRQRQGVGSALVRTARALADEAGEPLVVLEGSPAYYGRLGFEPSALYGLELPLPS